MKRILALLLTVLVLLCGCGTAPENPAEPYAASEPAASPEPVAAPGPTQAPEPPEDDVSAFPGTYTVPEGWVKAEKYSSADKVFYVESGHEDDELPDNISVNFGTNRYSEDEHLDFAHAITTQLMMQLQGSGAELDGSGSFTEQGCVLYTFTITDSNVTTVQYYIVGDCRFCLIHLTDFSGSASAREAAQAMADSFVWSE